jgi:hypothetical protein
MFPLYPSDNSPQSTVNSPQSTVNSPQSTVSEDQTWVEKDISDGGYIEVSANLKWPDQKLQCITSGGNGFYKNALDIAFTAKTVNFSSCASDMEVPIFAQKFNKEKGKICKGLIGGDISVLPPVLIQNTEKQQINFAFRYTGEREENISGYASILLGAASVVATGGAATTVATLSKAIQTTDVTKTSDAYSGLTKIDVAVPWSVTLSKDKLKSEGTQISIPFYKTEVSDDEELANVSSSKNKSLLFTAVFTVKVRRSLFTDKFLSPGTIPDGSHISHRMVLNYPPRVRDNTPNIIQRINNSAPSIVKALSSKEPGEYVDACRNVSQILTKNLCLSKYDRAIVYNALLTEAHGDKWTENDQLRSSCLPKDEDWTDLMNKVYGANYLKEPVTRPISPHVPKNEKQSWIWGVSRAMEALGFAFQATSAAKSDASNLFLKLFDPSGRAPVVRTNTGLWDPEKLYAKPEEQAMKVEDQKAVQVRIASELARIPIKLQACYFSPPDGGATNQDGTLAQHAGWLLLVPQQTDAAKPDEIWFIDAVFDNKNRLQSLTMRDNIEDTIKATIKKYEVEAPKCKELQNKL